MGSIAHQTGGAWFAEKQDLPRPLQVLNEKVTVLASSGQTGGLEIFHQKGQAGAGAPPHAHDWSETFYVLYGDFEFTAGTTTRRLGKGGVAHIPAGVMHSFQFLSDGEMVSVTSGPGGSKVFSALDAAVPQGSRDFALIASVIESNGVSLGNH